MNNLIKVGETINAKETMSSLQIAELTGKQHSNVMRDIRNILEQLEEKHKFNFELMFKITKLGNNAERKDPYYLLTKKDSLLLASGYDANLRAKIINRWEELEKEKRFGNFVIPSTFSEALMLAAKQAEEIEEKNKLLLEQTPKVEFYNAVTGSEDTIDMRTVATVLNMGIGRNKIFEVLRDKRVLDRKNMPYQKYIDLGYFRTVETQYTKSDGTNCINIKTVVFQKGLDFIRKTLTLNK
jgi:Rha family phage regulatory protein|nr:MAG TPA: KilAC domain protein [Caudoviricetes sp.]